MSDLTVTNASLGTLQSSNSTTYTIAVTPTAQDKVSLSMAENLVQDEAGNFNVASNVFEVTYDTVAPTVSTLVPANNAVDTTATAVTAFSITFSETMVAGSSNNYH